MRNMSFAMTRSQIINQTKTVTRRFGWWSLKPGDLIQAVEKSMGLKKGEKIKKLKIIEIVSTRLEPLNSITQDDVIAEGFPEWTPDQFVDMLVKHYKIRPDAVCNRIEFKYVKKPKEKILIPDNQWY